MRKSFYFFCYLIVAIGYIHSQELKLGLPLGHVESVYRPQFHPNRKIILTNSWDKTAKMWDLDSGKLLQSFGDHANKISQAQFSPDGKTILAICKDKTAKLWEVSTGKLLVTYKGHTKYLNFTLFSPDGKTVLTASGDKTTKLWETNTGKLLKTLKGHESDVNSAEFTSSGKKIITTSRDNTAILWDLNSGKILQVHKGHSNEVTFARFSYDEKLTLTVSRDFTVKIWKVNTGELLHTFEGHSDDIISAQFSSNRKNVLTASQDKTIKLWDVKTGKILKSFDNYISTSNSAKFNPDGKTIVTTSDNNTVKLWEIKTGKLLQTFEGHNQGVISLEFNHKGDKLLTASHDETAKLWNVYSGELLQTYGGHTTRVNSLKIKPKEKAAMVTSNDKTIRLLDINTGKMSNVFKGNASLIFSPFKKFIISLTSSYNSDNTAKLWDVKTQKFLYTINIKKNRFKTLSFSPDEKQILMLSNRSLGAYLIEVESGKLLDSLFDHRHFVNSAKFSPDGKTIITASNDRTTKLWETSTGKLIRTFYGHTMFVNSAQFIMDGKYILTFSSGDDSVKLWETNTGKLVRSFEDKKTGVNLVQISPNEEVIATTSESIRADSPFYSRINLWKVNTGKCLYSLYGHTAYVYLPKFSPDGEKILTTSMDKTAKLWEVNTGKLLYNLEGHTGSVISALFIDNGKRILTASDDGSMIIWDVETGKQLIRHFVFDGNPNKWVHLHPSGLFDASPEAMELMYWTKGLEVIDFSQLKKKYYEPGLWEKVMKGEYLGNIDIRKDDILLYPQVEAGKIENNILPISLIKRDGGYGVVSVFLNGKEIIKDARPKNFNHELSKQTLNVDISHYQKFTLEGDNTFMVKVANQTGDVISKGAKIINNAKKESQPPSFYAVIIGVSNYVGDAIDLKYPDADAEAIEIALQMGTKNLFEKSHIIKMTTNHSLKPRKEKIKAVLGDIAKKAKPEDVLLVYMSGHGINWTDNKNKTDFYFLTEDARFADKEIYNNKKIRETTSISTDEWVEYIKKIPANKTVMIIDACGSGKAVDNLIAQRDIDSEKIKAIDRMQDRTGMFVISGSAADKVSYEASIYGQGLLTYSLLKGMSGVALKDYTKIDVSTLFNYVKDEVNILAKDIGGVQEPQVLMSESGSFDIGILQPTDQKKIVVNEPKNVYLRSTFLNTEELEDNLELSAYLDRKLNSMSIEEKNVIWVDANQYINGCKISGSYLQKDDKIKLTYKVKCLNYEKKYTVMASTKESLVQKVIDNL